MSQQATVFYNEKTKHKKEEKRQESPILPLRQFNNWIKACLIHEYTPKGANVLDLCCGRGGDISKWEHAGVRSVLFVDVSKDSVMEASRRYQSSGASFQANFNVADVSSSSTDLGSNYYDVVSCQFAFHYLFDTFDRAQATLSRVAKSLKQEGLFLITIPSAVRVQACMGLDNAYCRLTSTAQGYTFWLQDAIDSVEEYLVPLDQLQSLAEQEGLRPVRLPTPFADYAQEHKDDLKHMRPDTTDMDKELWQVCCLYDVIVFQKQVN
jgi:mRNA (guanine-N7-)-methyltransferase